MRVHKVRPRYLYFAVEDNFLSPEAYTLLLTKWIDAKLPFLDMGTNGKEILADDALTHIAIVEKFRLGKYKNEIVSAIKKVNDNLGG
jgi:hypothetical protein